MEDTSAPPEYSSDVSAPDSEPTPAEEPAAPPEELDVHEEDEYLVARILPGRSRSADEAVGFFLLPVLVASTVIASLYVVVYLGIALAGTDPAIALVGWQSAWAWGTGLVWLGTTLAMWRSAPGVMRTAELKLDSDSVTLVEDGGVGFYALFRDLRGAAVQAEGAQGAQAVQVVQAEGEPLVVKMAGNSEEAARWVADLLQERIALAPSQTSEGAG
jgi:hypothetical protein